MRNVCHDLKCIEVPTDTGFKKIRLDAGLVDEILWCSTSKNYRGGASDPDDKI